MTESSFERLAIWQRGIEVTRNVYRFTKKLPSSENFGLISQMRRAAISIPSNIAEGRQRSTKKDFAQFLRIALGSAAELETQIILSEQLYPGPDASVLRTSVQELQRMIASFIKKLG
ncbi:MAG TPA: four helix bundle protein [Candidatus Paceibacterota bacterium]|nr:four helix bundle protein [Candidatus Paceibacterota bacterium]